jgi:hypothetical protein
MKSNIDVLGVGMMNLVLYKKNNILTITMDIHVLLNNSQVFINPYNQIASLKTSITATYFVLVFDKATIDCNVDLQLTSPLASINI